MRTHYVYGSGSHGCLYDFGPNVSLDINGAVDSLACLFELGQKRKAELKRNLYLELNPKRDGADYCEITECSCDYPEDHCEGGIKEWEEINS